MQDSDDSAIMRGMAEAGGHQLKTGSELNCGFANIPTDTKEAMYAAMTPDDKTVIFILIMHICHGTLTPVLFVRE